MVFGTDFLLFFKKKKPQEPSPENSNMLSMSNMFPLILFCVRWEQLCAFNGCFVLCSDELFKIIYGKFGNMFNFSSLN